MTQTIFERLREMLSASILSKKDVIRNVLFGCTLEFIKSREFSDIKLSIDEKDFFEEFLEYIERDRPVRINCLIEMELNSQKFQREEIALEDIDLFCLNGIMKHRKLIFNSYENC